MAELIVTLKGRELQRFPITSHAVYIGRAPQCDLVLPNESVSREHASLSFTIKGFSLQPLSETNSLWVNGKLCARAVNLVDGDRVQLGKYVIELSVQGGPPLSVLSASDFDEGEHTTALPIDDLERYREARSMIQEPLSLEERRQARLESLSAALRWTRLALILSVTLNLLALLLLWREGLSLASLIP
jgi:predicted component of type VI protein secretion system